MRTFGLFVCCYAAAAWMPHVTGPGRWVLLALFMGLVAAMLRAVGRS